MGDRCQTLLPSWGFINLIIVSMAEPVWLKSELKCPFQLLLFNKAILNWTEPKSIQRTSTMHTKTLKKQNKTNGQNDKTVGNMTRSNVPLIRIQLKSSNRQILILISVFMITSGGYREWNGLIPSCTPLGFGNCCSFANDTHWQFFTRDKYKDGCGRQSGDYRSTLFLFTIYHLSLRSSIICYYIIQ